MPVLNLQTNISAAKIPEDFERQLCEKVGEVLNKPLERITLTITTNLRQFRASSADPMVVLSIHSIAVFDEEKNPNYTPPLLSFLSEKLSLPKSRILVLYFDLLPYQIGQQV
ncbi:hypothetical protein C0Q70_08570 [Pomacea canaliculata]|uniref:D-dopachrome decarboxylase n=1 Tax=Pomacea canaliculata TaxID=400727 RepID=A0A2T7PI68_POMCA|nr:D-dopachrome decarboxylase-like [Pomacea canaliculata]PVD33121.1 hypothetical protein C0Q70_08570 [Pomacea canaliculata]